MVERSSYSCSVGKNGTGLSISFSAAGMGVRGKGAAVEPLKRLAAAVQFRPWPPRFQQLTKPGKAQPVPFRSKKHSTRHATSGLPVKHQIPVVRVTNWLRSAGTPRDVALKSRLREILGWKD